MQEPELQRINEDTGRILSDVNDCDPTMHPASTQRCVDHECLGLGWDKDSGAW